jgi:hypothetical protein
MMIDVNQLVKMCACVDMNLKQNYFCSSIKFGDVLISINATENPERPAKNACHRRRARNPETNRFRHGEHGLPAQRAGGRAQWTCREAKTLNL